MIGRMAWESWIRGVVAAFVVGGSGAVTNGFANMIVDPAKFNLSHPANLLETMSVSFMFAGFLGMMAFLHQEPLPQIVTVTTVETKEAQKSPPAVVTTTVQKTEVSEPKV